MKIAVVGGGIAGIVSAYILSPLHEVDLFEAGTYLGGHTNTRVIEHGVDAGVAVDTGFIVCNPANYPNFYRFLNRLGVRLQRSEMSFGFYDPQEKFSYLGPSLREYIRQPGNIFRPKFRRLVLEQSRFNRKVLQDLVAGRIGEKPLGAYLQEIGASGFLRDHYVAPLLASIWSSPDHDVNDFPALTFATFFRNHGMLEFSKRPSWDTVVGGSFQYVKAFQKAFTGRVLLGAKVMRIAREEQGVRLELEGSLRRYDKVVIACHADQACSLLVDPTAQERELLSSWRYSRNHTVLHTDEQVMGGVKRRCWAAWNYVRGTAASSKQISITYYMNRLQKLRSDKQYFVTLNPTQKLRADRVLFETHYEHPIYTRASIEAQGALQKLNGTRNTFYCGAHLGYGFHEDGVNSALAVGSKLGATL